MILKLNNISKRFGEKEVITDISFEAESGMAFGLLGRNGAGKTTTIRILMDVFKADSGDITIDGTPIDYKNLKFGYLPEERGLYPKKKIFDQLVYFACLKGMEHKDAVKSVEYWLDRLGMIEHKNQKLDTLSKGNQQKIQLITALSYDPQVVILDEPFSGLDPVNALILKDVVKEEISRGKIVLFSSHQMNYIEEFCDNIAILNKGKVVLNGELNCIKRNYPRDTLCIRSVDSERIISKFKDKCTKRENNCIYLKLDSPDLKMETVNILTSSYDIDEIKVFEPSLNDIFVEYTGD